MKKKIVCLLCLINGTLWGKEVDLLNKIHIDFFDLYSISKSAESVETDSSIFSCKANFLFTEFCFSMNEENQNFGFALKTDNFCPDFPLSIKYGNLSVSGSCSKLSSPLLSASSSPFSSIFSKANCITAALPGSSSFSKPEIFFAQAAYLNKKKIFNSFKINGLYNPQTFESALSSLISLKFPENLQLNISETIGSFCYDENNFSSWFTTDDFYFHGGKHICGNTNVSLTSKKAGTSLSFSFYESPFGKYDYVFKSENFIKPGKCILSFSGLYNPKNTLTSSQKKIKNVLQFKNGFTYTFKPKITCPLFIKLGFNTYENFNLSQTEHNFRANSGIQLTSSIFALTLSNSLNLKLISEENFEINFDSTTFQIANNWYLSKLTATLKTSLNINPEDDFSSTSFSPAFYLGFRFKNNLQSHYSLNLTFKDNELSKMSQNSTLQLQIHKKHINFTYKLSFVW